ncbi:MAG TPA: prephenate dehydrogenase/arogenate dehydrogenase family protein, partial [Verrucomicrobiae bacterium]|nr:prephenate dehydrogenase/arogenate dehydrogenase family protein [Verrucomicrobiae bacterium]
ASSIAGLIEPGALITDVGSVKGPVVSELEPLFDARGAQFVGSHPMAGSERMGVSAARADLFQNAVCVLTPTSSTGPEATGRIEQLWKDVGSRVLQMPPEVHDQLVARSSHLPHILAAHLAAFVLSPEQAPEQSQLCANGFRDTTRIASGSPEMWRDIVLMNRKNLRVALQQYVEGLKAFDRLLEENDPAAVEKFFEAARRMRDRWVSQCSSTSSE